MRSACALGIVFTQGRISPCGQDARQAESISPLDAPLVAHDPRILGSLQVSRSPPDRGADAVDLRCLAILAARARAEPASDPTGDGKLAGVLRPPSGSTAESRSERLIVRSL